MLLACAVRAETVVLLSEKTLDGIILKQTDEAVILRTLPDVVGYGRTARGIFRVGIDPCCLSSPAQQRGVDADEKGVTNLGAKRLGEFDQIFLLGFGGSDFLCRLSSSASTVAFQPDGLRSSYPILAIRTEAGLSPARMVRYHHALKCSSGSSRLC